MFAKILGVVKVVAKLVRDVVFVMSAVMIGFASILWFLEERAVLETNFTIDNPGSALVLMRFILLLAAINAASGLTMSPKTAVVSLLAGFLPWAMLLTTTFGGMNLVGGGLLWATAQVTNLLVRFLPNEWPTTMAPTAPAD